MNNDAEFKLRMQTLTKSLNDVGRVWADKAFYLEKTAHPQIAGGMAAVSALAYALETIDKDQLKLNVGG